MEYKVRSKVILVRSEPGNRVGIYFPPESYNSLKLSVSKDFYANNLTDLDPEMDYEILVKREKERIVIIIEPAAEE